MDYCETIRNAVDVVGSYDPPPGDEEDKVNQSKAVTKQINRALEELFGTAGSGLDLGGIPQAVNTALVMLKGQQIKLCFSVTAKPKS